MIKVILIDNAGVLINTDCISFYKKLVKHCPYSLQHITRYIEDRDFHIMETGKISAREWFNGICRKFKVKDYSYGQFRKDWPKIFYRNKEMENFVRKNYNKIKIWMLTNSNSVHYAYLKKKFPIYNFIKNKVLSFKIKMAKPDKNIYRYTLKKLKLRPEECLFIDNKRANITAANKLGIKTIWYRKHRQFIKELKKFKI